MNVGTLRTIILLLCLAFVVSSSSCDRSGESQSSVGIRQPNRKPSVQQSTLPAQKEEIVTEEPVDYNPEQSLSRREYGRENPFEPLIVSRRMQRSKVVTRSNAAVTRSRPAQAEPEESEASQELEIRLTAILGENSAIFEEGSASKSVSIGDTIAGMKIMEIRNNEVLLSRGDKEYTIALRGQLKAVTNKSE